LFTSLPWKLVFQVDVHYFEPKTAMPRFQLPIAIALVTSVVISLITFYFTQTKEGKIQLPITANGQIERDIFDVLRPEDVTDGYPIDEESFWTRV
jgi:hypothetical protein